MKNIVRLAYASVALSAGLFVGCGGGGMPAYDKEAGERQIKSTQSLTEFMKANPDIAAASLKDIRAAGGGGRTSMSIASATELRGVARNISLKADKASEAVKLIDEVFYGANLKTVLAAFFKLVAVSMNFREQDMKDFEKKYDEGGKPSDIAEEKVRMSFKAAVSAKAEKGGSRGGDRPSCEDLMEDPKKVVELMAGERISQEDFDKGLNEADKEFKKQVGNCKVEGGAFAKCMKTFADQVKAVHASATCSVKTPKELEKAIENSYGKNFKAMEKEAKDCYKIFDESCDFDIMNFGGGDDDEDHKGHGHHDGHHHGDKPNGEGVAKEKGLKLGAKK